MHFLVFIYLLVMIVICAVVLCKIFVAFVEDIGWHRWKWIPLHIVTFTTLTLLLLHHVGIMVKLFNA